MDAHDELFYRLNDPDPHTRVMAELDLLYKIFGGNLEFSCRRLHQVVQLEPGRVEHPERELPSVLLHHVHVHS